MRVHAPRRPWASHKEGENSEKMDTIDTILIHSANIASSTLMQWSHETMFAIVIFNTCRQLLRTSPPDPNRGCAPGPAGGRPPHTPGSTVKLQVAVRCPGFYCMCDISSINARSRADCRNDQISVVSELEETLSRGYSLLYS